MVIVMLGGIFALSVMSWVGMVNLVVMEVRVCTRLLLSVVELLELSELLKSINIIPSLSSPIVCSELFLSPVSLLFVLTVLVLGCLWEILTSVDLSVTPDSVLLSVFVFTFLRFICSVILPSFSVHVSVFYT